jgi:hypothetical protein
VTESAESRYDSAMANRDEELYGRLWTPWADLADWERDFYTELLAPEDRP